MFKRFKIVKHYTSPEDYVFRVYERRFLFFWEHLASYSNELKACEGIRSIYMKEQAYRDEVANTPKPQVIRYE